MSEIDPLKRNLRHGELSVFPHGGWLERQHDLLFRNTGFQQVGRDAVLDSVPLNPYLSIDDIDVDQRSMHALAAVPSDIYKKVPVFLAVEYGFRLDITVRIWDFGVIKQY